MVAPPLEVVQAGGAQNAGDIASPVDLHAAIVQPPATQTKPRMVKHLWQLARKGGPSALERMKDIMDDAVLANLARQQLNVQEADTGRTALHYAAMNCDEQMTALLAKQRGIDLNILDHEGFSPVARAVQSGSMPTLIRLLSTAFANTHCTTIDLLLCRPDARDCSPMGAAVAAESPDLLDCLLSLVALQQSRAAFMRHKRSPSFSSGRPSISNISRSSSSSLKDSVTEGSAGGLRAALLRAPVDAAGRPPLLAALVQHKLAHAMVLVEAGASLCVSEPLCGPLPSPITSPTTITPMSPPTSSPSSLPSPQSSPSSSGSCSSSKSSWALNALPGSTPTHLAIQHVAQLKARQSGVTTGQAPAPAVFAASSGLLEPSVSIIESEQLQLACRLLNQMLTHLDFPEAAIMQDSRGDCVLHAAVRAGLVLVVEKIVQRAPNTLGLVNKDKMTAMGLAKAEGGNTSCAEMLQPFYSPGHSNPASSAWRVLPKSLSLNGRGSFKAIQLPTSATKVGPLSVSPVTLSQEGPLPSDTSSLPSPSKQETRQLIKPPKPGKGKGPASYSDYNAQGVDCMSGVSCFSFAGFGGRKKV